MKFRKKYDDDKARTPNDWISEEWRLTYSSKDDMVDVLQTLSKAIADFRLKYLNIKTDIVIDSSYTYNWFDLTLNRKLSDDEKVELKQLIKAEKENALKQRKRELKAEAKKLGLI